MPCTELAVTRDDTDTAVLLQDDNPIFSWCVLETQLTSNSCNLIGCQQHEARLLQSAMQTSKQ